MKELLRALIGYLTKRNYARVNRRVDELEKAVRHVDGRLKQMSSIFNLMHEEDVIELLENYKIKEAQIGRIYAILGEKPLPGLGDKLKVDKAPSDLAMKRRAIKAAKKISHARTKGKQIRRRK